jgi:hypothetical protein
MRKMDYPRLYGEAPESVIRRGGHARPDAPGRMEARQPARIFVIFAGARRKKGRAWRAPGEAGHGNCIASLDRARLAL